MPDSFINYCRWNGLIDFEKVNVHELSLAQSMKGDYNAKIHHLAGGPGYSQITHQYFFPDEN